MNATPEWITGLDQAAEDAQPEPEYDAEADQRAELEGDQPPPDDLTLEDEPQVEERVQQQSQQVPLATMLEERKKLQQQLDEERARTARFERLEDELRALRAQREVPRETPPQVPEPDYLEDPKGYVDQTREQLISRLKKLETTQEQLTRAQQEELFEKAVINASSAAEADFSQQQPDYYDALAHVREINARALELNRPDLSAADRRRELRREEIRFAANHLQAGRNPSEAAYKLAQTLGYRRPQEQNRPNGQDQAAASGVDRRRLQGMGGGSAGKAPADSELGRLMEGGQDEFDQAMTELFGKRR